MGWVYIHLKEAFVSDNCLKKVVEQLGLSFQNARELNRIIDEEMPGRPRFKHEEISLGGESFDFHFREVIPCIRTLFGDPNFARSLILVPERHYLDVDHTTRIFSEMHTGKWWWSVQVLPNSAKCMLLCAHCSIEITGVMPTRCNRDSSYHLIGQDATYTISCQVCIPNLLVNWEHSKTYPLQANPACANVIGIYSDNATWTHWQQGCMAPCPREPLSCVHA